MDEKKMLGVLLHLTEQQSATTGQLLEQLQGHVSALEAATRAAADAAPAAAKAAGDATRSAVQQALGQTQRTALEAFTQAARPYFQQLNQAKDQAHEAADRLQDAGQWFSVKVWAFAAGALLVAGVTGWTWMKWQHGQLQQLQRDRAALQIDVDQLRAQVADLEKRGGRIKLAQCDTNRLCIEAASNQGGGQTDWAAPWSSPAGQKYVIPKGY